MKKTAVGAILLVLFACKKEPTSWETSWTAPAVHGHLTLEDVLPAEYLTTNADNYYSIVYHKPVYTFTIDTLVKLPDTTIFKKSAITFSSLTVNPGFSYTDGYDQEYQLDQIELKQVRIQSGTVSVLVSCPWQGASLITFTFPKITKDGTPFERIYAMPAASLANPAITSEVIDLTNYMMDLTGTSGNLINFLSAVFEMGSNEATNTYSVTNTDSITYQIAFQNLKPDYAKGYFGQYYFSDTVGISLDFMKNITAGQIDVDSIDLTLTVKNGFNLLAQAKITQIRGLNTSSASIVDLSFPMLNNSLNINPASGGMYDYIPSEFPLTINSTNSNILSLIENMNDSMRLGYELEVNPFGNVTAGSDEIFPGSKLELFLDAEFPVKFGTTGLTLCDTFKVDYDNPENVYPQTGVFEMKYTNGFPLGAIVKLYLMDENNVVTDSILSVNSIYPGLYQPSTGNTTPANNMITFELTETNVVNLDQATHLILNVKFDSDQNQVVKINSDCSFDFMLTTDLLVHIEI